MTILVVDDDRQTRRTIEIMCRGIGHTILFASNGQEALDLLRKPSNKIQLVVSDMVMPVMDGEELLARILEEAPSLPVIMMTSHAELHNEVHVVNAGAVDYITKPLNREAFLHRINVVLEQSQMSRELSALRQELGRQKALEHIIGNSSALMEVLKKLPAIAKTDASVIIYGESGTGKELIAKAVHELSLRSKRPFVTMNCGALPENLLETELFGYKKGAFTDAKRDYDGLVKEADGGTLFLDEIGEVSLGVQVKLLRFLQEKEYKPVGSTKTQFADVRFVSATNRDLLEETRQGNFREDLYYRLNIIPLRLPPLRERKSDITLLAVHFLRKYARQLGREEMRFTSSAVEKLKSYNWPGNIREMENKILQVVVMNDRKTITQDLISLPNDHLEEPPSPPSSSGWEHQRPLLEFKEEKKRVVAAFEQHYLRKMLQDYEGNITQAAKAAGMDRKNFWQKMKRHNITVESALAGEVAEQWSH
jgi:DNA-binding NtrC family response regulator